MKKGLSFLGVYQKVFVTLPTIWKTSELITITMWPNDNHLVGVGYAHNWRQNDEGLPDDGKSSLFDIW